MQNFLNVTLNLYHFLKQTSVSSVLYWGQENQQVLFTVGLCLLAAAILVAAMILFLLRNRHIARMKLKDLTQSVDTEATRDYQVNFYFHSSVCVYFMFVYINVAIIRLSNLRRYEFIKKIVKHTISK